MKFSHQFEAALRKEEYPEVWLTSAISYRRLKKCIKRVKEELQSLGLAPEVLERLWQEVDADQRGPIGAETRRGSKDEPTRVPSRSSGFKPTLTIAVDPADGSPMDAWLSPQTRKYLQKLASSRQSERRDPVLPEDSASRAPSMYEQSIDRTERIADELACAEPDGTSVEDLETVEIPLTSNAEFFQILECEMAALEYLQNSERRSLHLQILSLEHEIKTVVDSSSSRDKKEVGAWRNMFEKYIESQIFFLSNEVDAGARDSEHASTRLEKFVQVIARDRKQGLKLGKSATNALDGFVRVNVEILRFLKFQEINRTALSKILKKFDKQTALHSQSTLPVAITTSPFVVQDLAKAACATISQQLLKLVPRLDDYLCPVCFRISWKPIRLRCRHIFCVRCLLVMQRTKQNHCPLCRGEVVMEASSLDLDPELMTFLKAKFPKEVKAKQKDNEKAAAVDMFGEDYQKCCVM